MRNWRISSRKWQFFLSEKRRGVGFFVGKIVQWLNKSNYLARTYDYARAFSSRIVLPRKWKSFFSERQRQVSDMVGKSIRRIGNTKNLSHLRAYVRTLFRKIRFYSGDKTVAHIDVERRTFVKYALFGGVVFLAGKYMSPFINFLQGDTVLSEKTFENFKITETGKKLLVVDDEGDEVLTIDKEGF